MTRTLLGRRRHVAKPQLEADLAAQRAARHLTRRFNLLPSTALAVAEAANLGAANPRETRR
jgi:hypothetical protein